MRSAWGSRLRQLGQLGQLGQRGQARQTRQARRSRQDGGSVTAELAVVLPAVMLVLVCCLGAVQTVGQQLRLSDAVADAARSLGRGDSAAEARGIARTLVGEAAFRSESDGRFVCVRLSAPSVFAPYAVLGLTVTARSCALTGGL